jgi:hypothetical protein
MLAPCSRACLIEQAGLWTVRRAIPVGRAIVIGVDGRAFRAGVRLRLGMVTAPSIPWLQVWVIVLAWRNSPVRRSRM